MQMVERRLHRRGAEGAAADAQHDKSVELFTDRSGGFVDIGHHFSLVVGELSPHHHLFDAAAGLLHGVLRLDQTAGQRLQLAGLDKVFLQQASGRIGKHGDGFLDLFQILALQVVGGFAQIGAHRCARIGSEVRHHVVEVEGKLHGSFPIVRKVFLGHNAQPHRIKFTILIIDNSFGNFHYFLMKKSEKCVNSLFFNINVLK